MVCIALVLPKERKQRIVLRVNALQSFLPILCSSANNRSAFSFSPSSSHPSSRSHSLPLPLSIGYTESMVWGGGWLWNIQSFSSPFPVIEQSVLVNWGTWELSDGKRWKLRDGWAFQKRRGLVPVYYVQLTPSLECLSHTPASTFIKCCMFPRVVTNIKSHNVYGRVLSFWGPINTIKAPSWCSQQP